MEDQFHSLADAEDMSGNALEFPRSRSLYDAVRLYRDYSLVETLRKTSPSGEVVQEILVVDVSCDGVPPSNSVGIEFSERLALCVPKDPQALIEVLALRHGFPLLMHQNSVLPDAPPSLCLYQEPPRSVARTWTAPSFLKRIQYWLERSARGSLHQADQPVEQLFFASPFELVLPWNFDTMREDPNMRFWVSNYLQRPGGGATLILEGSTGEKVGRTASVVNLSLQAVVHGRVENDFGTLGQLADALSAKGIDLLNALRSAVLARVAPGTEASIDDPNTILFLHIPVLRAEGEAPSRYVQKAYLLKTGMLNLGEATGALFSLKQDNVTRYYTETTTAFCAPPATTVWRGLLVHPVEILQCVDRADARRQSGVAAEGPSGTLVGAGALGSALLDLWTRSGWGEWSIIDNDHIKPHNLVRHQADAELIGSSKAVAAVKQVDSVMQGATKAKAIHADACDFADQKVVEALQSSMLVVDASTTLDYPRQASTRDDVGRHVSVFVTPSACAAVMLLEDADRKHRLRTLEAQYYRAILSEEWGRKHLDGNLGSYRSGASCRDISLVMPYYDVIGHAATLADRVPRLSSSPEAAIHVWVRDLADGSVVAHPIEVKDELYLPFDGRGLSVDVGVYDKMSSLRQKHLPTETGGILLGYFDNNINSVVVVDALPAPSDSVASKNSFKRGLDGVIEEVIEAGRRTAGVVGYIGEWHSHPKGCSASPSSDDQYQLVYLTLALAMEGLPAVMLIVSDEGICALQGVA